VCRASGRGCRIACAPPHRTCLSAVQFAGLAGDADDAEVQPLWLVDGDPNRGCAAPGCLARLVCQDVTHQPLPWSSAAETLASERGRGLFGVARVADSIVPTRAVRVVVVRPATIPRSSLSRPDSSRRRTAPAPSKRSCPGPTLPPPVRLRSRRHPISIKAWITTWARDARQLPSIPARHAAGGAPRRPGRNSRRTGRRPRGGAGGEAVLPRSWVRGDPRSTAGCSRSSASRHRA
jgi:hypothetical protein